MMSAAGHDDMTVESCISLGHPTEWNAALKGIKHAFAHTWENCYAIHLSTGFPTYLYTFQKGDTRIVCPIAERTFGGCTDIVTPYGFSGFAGNGPCPEFPLYWKNFVKAKGYVCGYIGLNPIFENSSYFEPDELYHYNNIYGLDLALTTDELFANLSSNRKRQLKYWEKSFSKITVKDSAVIAFFVKEYHKFFKSRKFSSTYNFSLETLSFLANVKNVFIAGVQNSGKIEAVSVFAYTPDAGDFLFNVSLDEGRKYSALLIWYGANYLKSMGVPFLNLGGGVRQNDGIATFKQRFGAKQFPLKCLKQVYESQVYDQLCRQNNADPNDRTGYFPPYQKP